MTTSDRWDADTAVESLYASHYRQLVRLSVLLVRDVETAEEVVQDSFVAMHGRWRTLKEPEKGLAYLRQTVVNRSRSVLRHRGVRARYTPPRQPDPPGADEDVLVSERRTSRCRSGSVRCSPCATTSTSRRPTSRPPSASAEAP